MREEELAALIVGALFGDPEITEDMTKKPDRLAGELLDIMIERGMLNATDHYSGGTCIVAMAQALIALITVTEVEPSYLSGLMSSMIHATHDCPEHRENHHSVSMRDHMQKISLALNSRTGGSG